MTQTAIVYSSTPDAKLAAGELADQIKAAMPGSPPDALILFASPLYDQPVLLEAVTALCEPRLLVGASSAGEFTSETRGEGLACALALRSSEMRFAAGVGRNLSKGRQQAAQQLVSTFRGASEPGFAYRSALVMTDALAGHADELVDELTLATSGGYQFFGGGAGDNAQFRRTSVFFGTEVLQDASVGLEMISNKPLGIGVGHGWRPASRSFRVTEADGLRLVSLNGTPAVEVFEQHAEETNQTMDRAEPIPFFLHNILGIETSGGHRLRVPLSVNEDGSIHCAAEVPVGAIVHIMGTTASSAADAAAEAAKRAVAALDGHRPQAALFFDCVATRLRMGEVFGSELEALAQQIGSAPYVGCNTHGQIARAEGQFGGFHNCTAVVCILPE